MAYPIKIQLRWLLLCGILPLSYTFSLEKPLEKTLTFIEIRKEGSLSKDFLLMIKDIFNASCFIETGTAGGGTTIRAAEIFEDVYTIELWIELFNQAIPLLRKYKNIRAYLGNSSTILSELRSYIETEHCIFFLDAHWDGGAMPKANNCNTPLLEELQIIGKLFPQSIILIDDLRCCQQDNILQRQLKEYPEETALEGYPSISQIKNLLYGINPDYEFIIYGDMGLVYPKTTYPHTTISPFLQGLTKSRFFDETQEHSEEETSDVLRAEQAIINCCFDTEGTATLGLLNRSEGREYPELFTTHYKLWSALVYLGRKEFELAESYLKKLPNLGFTHWRLQRYTNLLSSLKP